MVEEVIVLRQCAVCLMLFVFLRGLGSAAQQVPAPRIVTMTAEDGTALKASYFSAAKPGPGVLLLHQCNRQRKVWDALAERLASSGVNVLTLDYRGFGESGGTPNDKLAPAEQKRITMEVWPHDFDMGLAYLESQPGVQREKIGAGGASCGVNNSIQLARRHSEIKALMLLSGPTDREGRLFLHSSALPIFVSAADDDEFGNMVAPMQWWFSESPNSASRFEHYSNGGHGADMFAVHKELPGVIAEWFAGTLMNSPESLPKTNGSPFEPQVLRTLELINQPGGASEAAKTLAQVRERDPNAVTFPEFVVNLLGYEHIQTGDIKGAVEILKLNVAGYPNSPNTYDSLSDAYLAAGQKDLALLNAMKALELIANDKTDSEQMRNAIRDSAQQKVTQIEKPGGY
jgi:dienelactone hydrolase